MSTTFERAEVAAAFDEYLRRGAYGLDWNSWADLFTDDAVYAEHHLGTFHGREAIREWIGPTMAAFPNMTFDTEWSMIDGNQVAMYVWNNLPDPGTGKRYGFPNTTIVTYAGDGKFSAQADFYNPADAQRVFGEWMADGGNRELPPQHGLGGLPGWAPEPSADRHSRDEVYAEFLRYRQRADQAVATGDWNPWADQFTSDARYREHHFGTFAGQDEIRAWITGVMQPFPTMEFPLQTVLIDGNRLSAVIPNVLPDPTGGDHDYGFDVNVVLHYAGNGRWSYEEDVYNPEEAQRVIGEWVAAGGVLPGGEVPGPES